MKKIRLPEEKVRALSKEGLSLRELAERFGVSTHAINCVLKGVVEKPRTKWTPEIVDEWRNLKRTGLKAPAIAAQYNTTALVVNKKLAEQVGG